MNYIKTSLTIYHWNLLWHIWAHVVKNFFRMCLPSLKERGPWNDFCQSWMCRVSFKFFSVLRVENRRDVQLKEKCSNTKIWRKRFNKQFIDSRCINISNISPFKAIFIVLGNSLMKIPNEGKFYRFWSASSIQYSEICICENDVYFMLFRIFVRYAPGTIRIPIRDFLGEGLGPEGGHQLNKKQVPKGPKSPQFLRRWRQIFKKIKVVKGKLTFFGVLWENLTKFWSMWWFRIFVFSILSTYLRSY